MPSRAGPGSLQSGAALLALLALIVLAISWYLVATLTAGGNYTAAARNRNAAVMQRAKLALIGYVARQAVLAAERNPGRLPCPEARGYAGGPNEGIAAGSCTLPALGRLPWRTLGLDEPVDAYGEPLWYAVSPGWALPRPGAELAINSDSPGRLTLDGRPDAAVALIIAPGPALAVPATADCAPRVQSRGKMPPDARDYLECANATVPRDERFATNGSGGAFNDQVLPVTAADLLPSLEAAIKVRLERDVVPALKNVYAGPGWGLPAGEAIFPYAAPFVDPGASPFLGVRGLVQGLLPFSAMRGCDAAADARCLPGLTHWDVARGASAMMVGGSGRVRVVQCAVVEGASAWCRGTYRGAPQLRLTATQTSVTLALRRIDLQRAAVYYYSATGWIPVTATVSGRLAADASASIELSAPMPDTGGDADFYMSMSQDVIAEHSLLDRDDPVSGWFVRNEWFRLVYYAFAAQLAPGGSGRCSDSAPITCLQADGLAPGDHPRALLVLAGRSLVGAGRPNGRIADYLDSDENRDSDTQFEQRPVNAGFNDRLIVLDANP
jgi:hypothetical protein